MTIAETIKNVSAEKSQHLDVLRLSEEAIQNLLVKDFSGKYKTIEDY